MQEPTITGGNRRVRLMSGEGAGPGWCLSNQGYPYGANVDGVYACGPSTGLPQPFDTDGFQCVELSERFLWVVYGKVVPKVDAGADFVEMGHRKLHIPVGVPGPGHVPMPGDIVSLSGPTADPAGHTAVVTGVNVDSAGNGAVQLMEENGSLSGWDYIDVHHWRESFGNPEYYKGYYYYTNVSWLKLAAPPPATHSSALAGSLSYLVRPLGGNAAEAASVSPGGWVTGTTDERNKHHALIHRAILYHGSRLSVLRNPKTEKYLTMGAAVSAQGLVAGWSVRRDGIVLPSLVRRGKGLHWLPLHPRGGRVLSGQALGMSSTGEISGWIGVNGGFSTLAAVWARGKTGYRLRTLGPNRAFQYPMAVAADHSGDVVGTEMLGRHRTFAVLWIPHAKPVRLSSLYRRAQLDLPTSMTVQWKHGSRILSIVGSSGTWNGGSTAVVWHVAVNGHRAGLRRPVPISRRAGYRGSMATSMNDHGWITGYFVKGKATSRAFLDRPKQGPTYLGRLVHRGGWVITRANSIDDTGEIAAEGYRAGPGHASRPRAVLLIPVSARAPTR